MSAFTVQLLQYDIQWRDKSANFDKIRSLIQKDSDLILLPEMFQTGFSVKCPEEAESMDGHTIAFMKEISTQTGAAVAGSLMVEEEGQVCNRFVVVQNNEILAYYDKMHLFSPSAEGEYFAAGNDKVDVTIGGVKCRLITCYDLRFPYHSYNDSGYDLLLIGANWPVQRIAHWDALLKARAIENQALVAAVNRVGVDPFGVQYPGHSSAYNASGEQLLRFTGEASHRISFDLDELKQFREKLPYLRDQR